MDIDKQFKNKNEVYLMCLALCFPTEKLTIITHFTDSNARIPIKSGAGLFQFLTWGRRLGERGKLPVGGWVSAELKQKGHFDHYFPKEVKILATKFMEQDVEGRCIWSDITAGCYIQGLVLREKDECRVYIVTLLPEKPETPFTRWPLIISD